MKNKKGDFMKIKLDYLAEQLIDQGFSTKDIDSNELTNRVIELLDEQDFFSNLLKEMQIVEDNNHPEPKNIGDYLEKIGEV